MIRLAFFCILACFSWASAQTYDVTSRAGATVRTYTQLIDEAGAGRWRTASVVGQVPASSAPILQQAPFSSFHRLESHRALALGYPGTCPYSVRTTGFESRELAAAAALEQCLIRVAQFDGYQSDDCGCRLAIVDNLILGDPATTLAIPEFVPAYVQVGNRRTLGLLEHSGWRGRDLPITFIDTSGRTRCRGRYDIGSLIINNSFSLTCDLFDGEVRGTVGVRDLRSFNPWGSYTGQSAGGDAVQIVIAKPLGQP